EDVGKRFEAYQWHVQHVADGNELEKIGAAIEAAQADPRPSLIVLRTHIGYGAPTRQDSELAHGQALGEEEVRGAKIRLGWDPDKTFFVPDKALQNWRQAVPRGAEAETAWEELFARYSAEYPELAAEFERALSGTMPEDFDADLPTVPVDKKAVSTRSASNMAINALAPRVPELIGGSADLTGSNLTEIKGGGVLGPDASGRNIHYGVREHGMAAALNGMALHGGIRPFGGTFLIFSDYMRPAVRLAALMGAPTIFVWSHDSIGQGVDGPTHQQRRLPRSRPHHHRDRVGGLHLRRGRRAPRRGGHPRPRRQHALVGPVRSPAEELPGRGPPPHRACPPVGRGPLELRLGAL